MFKKLALIGAIFSSNIAWGYELNLDGFYNGDWLKVDESYVEYRKYQDYRNAYIPNQKDWDFTGHFHTTYSAYKYVFWQTDLHLNATTSQVMYGGLEYYLGVHAMPWLDVFKYHLSEHVFDHAAFDKEHFPLEDSYGVRVYFKK